MCRQAQPGTVQRDTLCTCRGKHLGDIGTPKVKGCCCTCWRSNKPPTNINDSYKPWKRQCFWAVAWCSTPRCRPGGKALHSQVGQQRHLLARCRWASGEKERTRSRPEHGQGRQLSFLLQVPQVRSQYWKSTPQDHYQAQFFFMFYMNSSNLFIKITELSIEKFSNWIQTIQMLKLS